MDLSLLATFFLLVGLELVLGIDNILLISILTSRLKEAQRERARMLGLAIALGARFALLFGVSALQKLDQPLIYHLTGRALVLIVGGLFLLYKASREMHFVVERYGLEDQHGKTGGATLQGVITQIVLLDMVFSIDSVITAVGLTDHLLVIFLAVILSFVGVLFFSKPIANFVQQRPTIKILALAFLLCIGVTLFAEGMGAHVPKGYIYLPMGFALLVELLQMRFDQVRKSKRDKSS